MKLPELLKANVRTTRSAKADHHVGLIFPQVRMLIGVFRCNRFWDIALKMHERGRGKQCVQPVRDADAHGTFCFAGLRLQVAGDGKERMVEPRQARASASPFWVSLTPRGVEMKSCEPPRPEAA